jgi:type I restriction enzyme S subunit
MSIAATVGLPVITAIPACIHDGFIALQHLKGVDQTYLLYTLKSLEGELRGAGQTGSQSNINTDIVKGLIVRLPPEPEQRRIVEALQDAGHQIGALEKLIAKKEAVKRGVMRKLLAPQSGDSEMVPLGAVTSWLSGGTPNRTNSSYWSGSIPWVSASTLKRLEVSTSAQFVTPAAVKAGSRMAPINSTLLLVRGSALHSEIRASLVTNHVSFNQDLKALVPATRLHPKFLIYSIHGNSQRLLRLVTSAGNTAGVLDTKVLKRFDIWLPSPTEQERIVAIMDDLESDIDGLDLRLAKAEEIKQGMMQELLTGRTRLSVPGAATA